jgi:hypothetical protein
MNSARLVLLLVPFGLLVGCGIDPSTEALESLGETSFSPKYHSGFWAAEAQKKSPLWEKAQGYCRPPEHADTPNCRVVVAVDVTVRVIPVRPGEDVNERIRQWIRRGGQELGPEFPRQKPGTGFGPRDLPNIPTPPRS